MLPTQEEGEKKKKQLPNNKLKKEKKNTSRNSTVTFSFGFNKGISLALLKI